VYGSSSITASVSTTPPYKNPDHDTKYNGKGGEKMFVSGIKDYKVMTKCTFCVHRLAKGLEPACANICPVNAITFGDLDDPNSVLSDLISKNEHFVLKEHLGTKPKVFYITRRRR
jgi:molybdopterin-containing oxidoreductase family iron-sulfur binding subunit